ncbi:hypothetical protein MesoLj113c_43760 [Mesorhizobium sp. 113-3-9]|nr:hypothetical protein MesoLj113c_43760 [Mesorhizobium sp. 113-3-9]
MAPAGTRQDGLKLARNPICLLIHLGRGNGGKSEGLDAYATPAANAVVEREFHAEAPAGLDLDAKRLLIIGE